MNNHTIPKPIQGSKNTTHTSIDDYEPFSLTTPCPHGISNDVYPQYAFMVCSHSCQRCLYCNSVDIENLIVHCTHPLNDLQSNS